MGRLDAGDIAVEIDRRHAIELQRRPCASIGIDEGAGLHAGRGDGARLEQHVLQAVAHHGEAAILAEIAESPCRARDDGHFVMILQVAPDARQIGLDGDAMLRELVGRADARQHQELRRHIGAGRDDHLGIGMEGFRAGRAFDLHARRPPVLDADACRHGVGDDGQLRIGQDGAKEGVDGAAPAARLPVDRVLHEADAGLAGAVEIRRCRERPSPAAPARRRGSSRSVARDAKPSRGRSRHDKACRDDRCPPA